MNPLDSNPIITLKSNPCSSISLSIIFIVPLFNSLKNSGSLVSENISKKVTPFFGKSLYVFALFLMLKANCFFQFK